MKDKLRDLLGELMSACEMIGYATSGNERASHRSTRDQVKAELLALIDAEGDGGAVAWQIFASGMRAEWEPISKEQYEKSIATGRYLGLFSGTKDFQVRALYPHPARSGVVRDEDVRDAERYRWLRDHSQPSACAFYLSVGMALHGIRFEPQTVDSAIDAAIQGETP